MADIVSLYFMRDGGPMNEPCAMRSCFKDSSGTFLVVNEETDEELGAVQLCEDHAKNLATGV